MKDPREFCTCTDTKGPNHPVNHEQGLDVGSEWPAGV